MTSATPKPQTVDTWRILNFDHLEKDDVENMSMAVEINKFFLSDDELCLTIAEYKSYKILNYLLKTRLTLPVELWKHIGAFKYTLFKDILPKLPHFPPNITYICNAIYSCCKENNVEVFNYLSDLPEFRVVVSQKVYMLRFITQCNFTEILHNVRVCFWPYLSNRSRLFIVYKMFWSYRGGNPDILEYMYINFFNGPKAVAPRMICRMMHNRCSIDTIAWLLQTKLYYVDWHDYRSLLQESFSQCLIRNTLKSYSFATIILKLCPGVIEHNFGLGLINYHYKPLIQEVARIKNIDISKVREKHARVKLLNSLDPIF